MGRLERSRFAILWASQPEGLKAHQRHPRREAASCGAGPRQQEGCTFKRCWAVPWQRGQNRQVWGWRGRARLRHFPRMPHFDRCTPWSPEHPRSTVSVSLALDCQPGVSGSREWVRVGDPREKMWCLCGVRGPVWGVCVKWCLCGVCVKCGCLCEVRALCGVWVPVCSVSAFMNLSPYPWTDSLQAFQC